MNTSSNAAMSSGMEPVSAPRTETGTLSLYIQAAAGFAIGAAFVFLVGFAHSDVVHNAAHDTRHALAFPCH